MPLPPDLPAHDQLADFLDADDWDRELHGRFTDFADLPEPVTEVHEGLAVSDAVHDEAAA